jgi:hypothetical protein
MTNHTPTVSKSPNRSAGMTFGTIYLVLGLLGFFFPGSGGFFSGNGYGGMLLGFLEVNPAHNVLHILIGAALLIAAQSAVSAAQTANRVIGVLLFVIGFVGFFPLDNQLNALAANIADDVLHIVSAVILLGVGFALEKDARQAAI